MTELKNIKELASMFENKILNGKEYGKHTKRAIISDIKKLVDHAESDWGEEYGSLAPAETARWKNICLSFVLSGRYGSTKARRLFSARLLSDFMKDKNYLESNPLREKSFKDFTGTMHPKLEDITIVSENAIKCMVEKAEESLRIPDPIPMLVLGVFLSGLKMGEATALTWDDVIIKEGAPVTLKVNERVIPLTTRVDHEAFIFAVNIGRTLHVNSMFEMSRSGVVSRLRSLSDSCGGKEIRGADFRWRYIVDLVKSGFHIQIIANVSGVTEVYLERLMPVLLEHADNEQ